MAIAGRSDSRADAAIDEALEESPERSIFSESRSARSAASGSVRGGRDDTMVSLEDEVVQFGGGDRPQRGELGRRRGVPCRLA